TRHGFHVLSLAEPLILPADNLPEFQRQVAFSGVMPAAGHTGRFAVLLEPLKVGRIGWAALDGVVPVRLAVDPADLHGFADIEAGSYVLRNLAQGSAQVLWLEPGAASESWGGVRLGMRQPGGATGEEVVYNLAGTVNDLNPGSNIRRLLITGSGTITGFAAGIAQDDWLILANRSNTTVTIANNGGGSSPANRVQSLTGQDFQLT